MPRGAGRVRSKIVLSDQHRDPRGANRAQRVRNAGRAACRSCGNGIPARKIVDLGLRRRAAHGVLIQRIQCALIYLPENGPA